jgi:hypothetical protein
MTTFHDQQPQSRRAVRQSERADGAESQAGFTQDEASAPQQYSAPAGDMWDTVSRRAAQLPPVSSPPEQATPGRRSATPPTAQPEPLHYSTQSRPAVPSYEGPTFRSRGSAAPQPVPFEPSAAPATQAVPKSEQPTYRVRDFSPESRSAAQDSQWTPGAAPSAPAAPSDLDYHTEARFRAAAAAAPMAPVSEVPASVAPINKLWAAPVPTPVVERPVVPANSEFPLEQTFTRRELRAMQQAEEASLQSQQPAAPQPAASYTAPAPAPQPAASYTATPAASLQTQQPAAPVPSPVLQTQQPVAPPAAAFPLVEPTAPPTAAASPIFTPAAPVSSSPFDSLFSPPAAPVQTPLVAEVPAEIAPAPVADAPSPWTPPTGHWSTQLDLDDDIETTISRRVGSGSTTTSALVLPSIPNGTDIRGPLTSTGEIMLTGSIDLPRNLSATGQSDRFDHGGIDELFDLSDSEVISTDSSPVRAIRAVSTHTSGHGVTHTQKPKGTRALTALLIAASSMAVVVAGLLVAAFAFNVFG